ncbi:MAG: ABC transporter ATP-binding protein [Planctomycetales bacterium]|nr:ABC transporter ATP-binding protein [Planctomycetales bacterium]
MQVTLDTRQTLTDPFLTVPPTPTMTMRGVCKGYGSGSSRIEVLTNINLNLRAGEFLTVVGFSGSGKTTFTKLLAGLEKPDAGTVLFEGQTVTGPGPERGLVFQNYSLLPWLTVRGNIALSVDRVFSNWTKGERRDHVERFIEMVGLKHAAHRRPHELSGGMRQRTSLARTLAMKPKVLLLDEPLSALDALTRSVMQDEILRIWEEEKQTCLMITNDVDEAIVVSDRIVALNPGPNASLGPMFTVDLKRPRDRTELNHDEFFKGLRNAVTNYLVAVRQKAREQVTSHAAAPRVQLPDLVPILSSRPSAMIYNRSAVHG